HPELVEQLEEPPDAHAVAVVAPAVDAVALRLIGRRDGRALADAEAEGLDVERDVDGQPPATGPRVVRSCRDVGVVVAPVGWQHVVFALPPPRGCAIVRRVSRPVSYVGLETRSVRGARDPLSYVEIETKERGHEAPEHPAGSAQQAGG